VADAKSKILIVEDDLDVAEMLNAYFRVQGYDVFTVNWGEDGVRAAQTVLPDLMILDIRLPDIDGYEVARRVRTDRRTNEIPIIFLTEKRERIDRLQGLKLAPTITSPSRSMSRNCACVCAMR
jgi:DNA-binding response OmpR family regulator